MENLDVSMKHSDQSHIVSVSNTTLQYFWTPFSGNITHKLQQIKDGEFEIIIMGAAVWDALHTRSVTRYSESLEEISETLSKLGQKDQKGTYTVWMQPTTIIDARLNTPEKQKYMTENIVEEYRSAYRSSHLSKHVSFSIDPSYVTAAQESTAVDGVHYSIKVSQVLSQMIANGYLLQYPSALPAKKKDTTAWKTSDPDRTMGHPLLGLLVLIFSCVMVVFFDSFLGMGVLGLALFGRSLDWNSAYIPLLTKLGMLRPDVTMDIEATNSQSDREDESGADTPLLTRDKGSGGSGSVTPR